MIASVDDAFILQRVVPLEKGECKSKKKR